eukprot:m.174343 g.174343  ORF g.174343 m.174343 type:complete len:501 (+) comp17895_c2_seq2:209-1711(+)
MAVLGWLAATGLALVLVLVARWAWMHLRASATLKELRAARAGPPPRVPDFIPFVGHAASFGANPLKFLQDHRAKYGDTFQVLLAGNVMTFFCDRRSHATILRRTDELSFGEVGDSVMESCFGVLPGTNDAVHQRDPEISKLSHQHLLASEGLHVLTTRAQHAVHQNLVDMLDAASAKGRSQLFEAASRCLFLATMEAVFSKHFATEQAFQDFLMFDNKFPFLVAGIPAAAFGGAVKARERLAGLFHSTDVYHKDASEFTKLRDETFAEVVTDEQRSRWQLALVWASVSNTMPSAFWTLYFLCAHPEAMAAVRAEVDALASDPDNEPSTCKGLPHATIYPQHSLDAMGVLDSVISETFRLTSGSMVMRLVTRDEVSVSWPAQKRGISLQHGDRVCLYPPLDHYDEEVFPSPETFKYDRFLGAAGKKLERDHLMPFGGGASLCPGRKFARNEVRAFVATVVRCCDLSLVEPEAPRPDFDVVRSGLGIFSPKKDVAVNMSLRK